MKKFKIQLSETTLKRRSSTVAQWNRWIINKFSELYENKKCNDKNQSELKNDENIENEQFEIKNSAIKTHEEEFNYNTFFETNTYSKTKKVQSIRLKKVATYLNFELDGEIVKTKTVKELCYDNLIKENNRYILKEANTNSSTLEKINLIANDFDLNEPLKNQESTILKINDILKEDKNIRINHLIKIIERFNRSVPYPIEKNHKIKTLINLLLDDSILELDNGKEKNTELSGWKKLIFEKIESIPGIFFTLEELYSFSEEFEKHYPNNSEIKSKIRQTLQQLRDIGHVKFVGNGIYQLAENDLEKSYNTDLNEFNHVEVVDNEVIDFEPTNNEIIGIKQNNNETLDIEPNNHEVVDIDSTGDIITNVEPTDHVIIENRSNLKTAYITKLVGERYKNRYRINKFINGKLHTFGHYSTLEEAIIERDKLIENNWFDEKKANKVKFSFDNLNLSEKNISKIKDLKSTNKLSRSRERSVKSFYFILSEFSEELDISDEMFDDAFSLYLDLIEKGSNKGVSVKEIFSALIYIASRLKHDPRTFDEIATVTQLNKTKISRMSNKITKVLGIQLPISKPEDYLPRLVKKCGVGDGIKVKTYNLMSSLGADFTNVKNPITMAIICLYHEIKLSDSDMTQDKFLNSVGTTQTTLRKRYAELSDYLKKNNKI